MTSRRDLLKSAAAAGAGLALTQFGVDEASAAPEDPVATADSMVGVPFERRDTVRIAIVGTGLFLGGWASFLAARGIWPSQGASLGAGLLFLGCCAWGLKALIRGLCEIVTAQK